MANGSEGVFPADTKAAGPVEVQDQVHKQRAASAGHFTCMLHCLPEAISWSSALKLMRPAPQVDSPSDHIAAAPSFIAHPAHRPLSVLADDGSGTGDGSSHTTTKAVQAAATTPAAAAAIANSSGAGDSRDGGLSRAGSGVHSPSAWPPANAQQPANASLEPWPNAGSQPADSPKQRGPSSIDTGLKDTFGPVSSAVPFRRARGKAALGKGGAAKDD